MKYIPVSIFCLLISIAVNPKPINAQINYPIFFADDFIKNEYKANLFANQPKNILSVTGEILYREKIALPADSVINIKLVDISRQDTASITISEKNIITNGQQVPIAFKLNYNSAEIKPHHTYAVQARITINNQLTFISTKSYPVITRNNPRNVKIMLEKVNYNSSQTSQTPSYVGKWLLEDLGGIGVIDDLQTTMELTADGKIFGNAGCNNYTGSYTIENKQLKISPLASTRKMCTPSVMDQEDKFLQALSSVGKIEFNHGFLFIESTNTEKPLKFTLLKEN